jgi:transcriptional regulator with XRE-family HTH domain
VAQVKHCIIEATVVFMQNTTGIDLEKLAAHLRTKRGDRGLRFVADEIGGVSASTLSRIEQGSAPDLPTFVRICAWLGVSTEDFVEQTFAVKRGLATSSAFRLPDAVEAQLRQERVLPSATVDAISEMIRVAYRSVEVDQRKKSGK